MLVNKLMLTNDPYCKVLPIYFLVEKNTTGSFIMFIS